MVIFRGAGRKGLPFTTPGRAVTHNIEHDIGMSRFSAKFGKRFAVEPAELSGRE